MASGDMGARVSAEWSPSERHPDKRREAAAQMLARGVPASTAYAERVARKEVTSGTARTNGMKLRKEPAMIARVEHIKAERAAAEEEIESFDHTALAATMREATESLEHAYKAAEQAGADPKQLSRIRRALTTHISRMTAALESTAEAAPAAKTNADIVRLDWCDCDA